MDSLEALRVPVKILEIFGLWQSKESTRNYKIYGIIMHLFFFNLPLFLHLSGFFDVASIEELIDVLLMLPTFIAMFLKSILLVVYMDEISSVLLSLEAFLKTVKLSDKEKRQIKVVDKLFKVFWFFAMLGYTMGGIHALMTGKPVYKVSFDCESTSLRFWITFALQNVSGFGFCCVAPILDFFPVFFLCYACVILENFAELIETEASTNDFASLVGYIEKYEKIKDSIRHVERIFSKIFFSHGMMSIITLCTTTLCLISVSVQ